MSRPITLPRWLSTQTMQLSSLDVAVAFALTLRIHGTADAVRTTAHRMRDKVCMEHRPKLRLLAREPDDAKVLTAATNITNRVTALLMGS